ncbi:6-O-methylguanine DNA methyltransferase [Enterococcus sp. JM4C]|uniref:DNA alkylation repair protein n=1 Tax=Candidatus Enterococcus huntleyi TaxID=1857217 RepID=UPI00137AA968|nr:DNA alkylation repair protein [Enterococcus sp. JM4C]KAF1297852.1 6-O-methylguanine DNA methyltransferase [Enterococcus sp. JM4C]
MEPLIFPNQPEQAAPMKKYMKNHFPFAGVPKPQRAQLEKVYLKESLAWLLPELLLVIQENYHKEAREYQYYAIDLALKNVRRLSLDFMKALLPLLGEKSWWDSIDAWRKVYSEWVKLHPDELHTVYNWFYGHENFWYRRMALNLQLQHKEQVNLDLLKKAIIYDKYTDEFFIQKAIGWALREYSKTDATWVIEFLAAETLSPLAKREASKYL